MNQFKQPYILCGDFNAHNILWSGRKNDKRGEQLEEFMSQNDLGLLNTDIKTHFNRTQRSWSLLDLSIIHPALYLDFDCDILDFHGSDHTPIMITFNKELFENDKKT